jgi:hypothetical protein
LLRKKVVPAGQHLVSGIQEPESSIQNEVIRIKNAAKQILLLSDSRVFLIINA